MPAELSPSSVAEAEDPAYWFLNTLNIVKATSESTCGAYSMICSTSPPGHETPYHLHHEEEEAARERVLPPPTAPDIEKLTRLCTKYKIDILGPLPR
jgi:hypothetical protein